MPRLSIGHYLVGLEGLALLRDLFIVDREDADARVAELRAVLAQGDAGPLGLQMNVTTEDVASGYARWASTYDVLPNPLVRLEEPVVRAIVDRAPPGDALDAACGTGRHAAHLRARGHRVVGVDASPAMLARARARVPDGDFRQGELTALPLADASVDFAVCALALTHLRDLVPPVRELARVLRRGGRLVVSDFHPFQVLIGGSAFFMDERGGSGHVRTYHHPHGAYLDAFRTAGLQVERCLEPADSDDEVALKCAGVMDVAPDTCRRALVGLPGVLVWELVRDA
jgi:ubiquinone/menaquinone biosynthesis C-methylase UbiE